MHREAYFVVALLGGDIILISLPVEWYSSVYFYIAAN